MAPNHLPKASPCGRLLCVYRCDIKTKKCDDFAALGGCNAGVSFVLDEM